MEKKENKKNNKKIAIIGGIIAAVAVIILCVVLFSHKSNQAQLEDNLKKLGTSFYEDYYYPSQKESQKDVKKFLERFKDNGIRINLTNLAKVSKIDQDLIKEMKNSKTNKKCNYDETYVTIYPKAPYKKTSYKLETTLKCGFEKEDKTDKKEETKKAAKKEETKKAAKKDKK
ncbi:MAG: hypothetical protein IKE75_02790 [Bacilli bacterium]|nr:hypothetical protein [Bacilli bacterium]